MEEKKRGFTKENVSNLFRWEKSDWWWAIFFIFLLFSAYGYYRDVEKAKEVYDEVCVRECLLNKYVAEFQKENPNLQISNCDVETMTCVVSGVVDEGFWKKMNMSDDFNDFGINISINETEVELG